MVPVGRSAQTEPPSEVQHATMRHVWMLLKNERERGNKNEEKNRGKGQERERTNEPNGV